MIDYFITEEAKGSENGLFSRFSGLRDAISGERSGRMHSDNRKNDHSIRKGG